jgi:fructokinase
LLADVRSRILELVSGYTGLGELTDPGAIDDFVVAPAVGELAGLIGAIELARASTERTT